MKKFPVLVFIGVHLVVSAAIEAVFVWKFGHNPRAIVTHVLVVAEWDLVLWALVRALITFSHGGASWPRWAFRFLFALTCTLQVYLYALNLVSNMGWGRNMTARLVSVFAPTVWSGKEPFPVGPVGISIFASGTLVLTMVAFAKWGRLTDESLVRSKSGASRFHRAWVIVVATAIAALFRSTVMWGIASNDNLLWTHELVASFFRPIGYAFEPTARRYAMADRDAVLQAAYPRQVPKAHLKNVVIIIVDSLRADRMEVYGYPRPTTPFLSQLVRSGCMKRVEAAFSLTGIFDNATRFRATKEGYVTATRTLSPPCTSCNANGWIHFSLEVAAAPVNLAGDYTLTFVADSACSTLPSEVRTRSYTATIPLASNGGPANGFTVTGALEGWEILELGVAGNYVAIWLETLVAQIAPNAFVSFGGLAAASIDTSAPSTIELPFDGTIDYCVTKSDVGRYEDCYTGTHARCTSKKHQLILTRR